MSRLTVYSGTTDSFVLDLVFCHDHCLEEATFLFRYNFEQIVEKKQEMVIIFVNTDICTVGYRLADLGFDFMSVTIFRAAPDHINELEEGRASNTTCRYSSRQSQSI